MSFGTVTITVRGPAASGNTWIMQHIEMALRQSALIDAKVIEVEIDERAQTETMTIEWRSKGSYAAEQARVGMHNAAFEPVPTPGELETLVGVALDVEGHAITLRRADDVLADRRCHVDTAGPSPLPKAGAYPAPPVAACEALDREFPYTPKLTPDELNEVADAIAKVMVKRWLAERKSS